MLRFLLTSLLGLLAIWGACSAIAHAETDLSSQPNLFDSLGKLLQAKPQAPMDRSAGPPTVTEPTTAARNLTRAAGERTSTGRRVALVIGNGAYRTADLTPLANPPNDADDIAAALRGFGFEVLAHKNLDRRRMKDAIAEFGRRATNAEAALFYFAGHGIQIRNQNFLMPIDASVRSEADVADEGINVNFPLEELENAQTRVNLVVLDACRNNDFSGRFRSGGSRGLAAPSGLPKGTVIVYATDPGNTASDGEGRNGLFTAGLLTAFKGQDLSLDGVLTTASAVVEEMSDGKQTPYINGPQLVKKNFYFIFKGPTTVQVQTTADPEGEAWKAAQDVGSATGYDAYLASYPGGRYAAAAKVRLADLRKADQGKGGGVVSMPAPVAREDTESAFWNEVKTSGAREYLDAYLKQYPKGRYLALARIELRKLDDRDKALRAKEELERKQAAEQLQAEQARAEQDAWQRAKSGNSAGAYSAYLDSFPNGRFAALAEAARQKVEREASERARQEERERLAAAASTQIRFSELPLDLAIKQVKGNGKRMIAIFEDPNCIYCKRLAKELQSVTDITIYSLLFPILSQDSIDKANAIWCAPDRLAARNNHMIDGTTPAAGKCDTSALAKVMAMGKKLNILGTPTIFLANGDRIPGYLPAAKLEEAMKRAAEGR